MFGPTLVELADAYERHFQQTEDPDDAAYEIRSRLEAANEYFMNARPMDAWRQRYRALRDLLNETGQVRSLLDGHPVVAHLDIADIKKQMGDFELGLGSAKTASGMRPYSEREIQEVTSCNQKVGIGRVNPAAGLEQVGV